MGFDIIGDIAIIKLNVPNVEEIVKKIKEKHKYVKVILLQESKVECPFRIPKYKILWGENRTETIHKEFGLRFKVDVARCYYSPRLENERMRITKQVRENEEILVMFSGVNPYPIFIAKFSNPKLVYSVEINPFAVKYGLENVKLNKVENKVITILGDVRDACPIIHFLRNGDGVIKTEEWYIKDILESGLKLNRLFIKITDDKNLDLALKIPANEKYIIEEKKNKVIIENDERIEIEKFEKKFDRIVMPLPKEAEYFLDLAINLVKPNGIIHFYCFLFENEIPQKAFEILEKYSKELGFKYEILNVVKCGDIGPRQYRVCVDFKVIK